MAYHKLNKLCCDTIRAMITVDFTSDDVVNWLFTSNTQRVLREAYYIVNSYNSGNLCININTDITLWLHGWDERKMALPDVTAVNHELLASEGGKLFRIIDIANEIRKNYAMVHKVVQWLDQHGTVGAFKYYFPQISLLAPSFAARGETGHYREPEGVSTYLPLIREASATVAKAAMLPVIGNPIKYLSQLHFGQRELTLHGVQCIASAVTVDLV